MANNSRKIAQYMANARSEATRILGSTRQFGLGFGQRLRSFLGGGMGQDEGFKDLSKYTTGAAYRGLSASGKSQAGTGYVAGQMAKSVLAARNQIASEYDAQYGMGTDLTERLAGAITGTGVAGAQAGLAGAYAKAGEKQQMLSTVGQAIGSIWGPGGSAAGGAIGSVVGGVLGKSDKAQAGRKARGQISAAFGEGIGMLEPLAEHGEGFRQQIEAILGGEASPHMLDVRDTVSNVLQSRSATREAGVEDIYRRLKTMRGDILAPLQQQFDRGTRATSQIANLYLQRGEEYAKTRGGAGYGFSQALRDFKPYAAEIGKAVGTGTPGSPSSAPNMYWSGDPQWT